MERKVILRYDLAQVRRSISIRTRSPVIICPFLGEGAGESDVVVFGARHAAMRCIHYDNPSVHCDYLTVLHISWPVRKSKTGGLYAKSK